MWTKPILFNLVINSNNSKITLKLAYILFVSSVLYKKSKSQREKNQSMVVAKDDEEAIQM